MHTLYPVSPSSPASAPLSAGKNPRCDGLRQQKLKNEAARTAVRTLAGSTHRHRHRDHLPMRARHPSLSTLPTPLTTAGRSSEVHEVQLLLYVGLPCVSLVGWPPSFIPVKFHIVIPAPCLPCNATLWALWGTPNGSIHLDLLEGGAHLHSIFIDTTRFRKVFQDEFRYDPVQKVP